MNAILKWIFVILSLIILSPFWLLALFLVKNSVVPEWEFGNMASWVSTFGTFLTVGIAYKAYKSVPDWISKKNIERGTEIIHDLVDVHLPDLQQHTSHLKGQITVVRFNLMSPNPYLNTDIRDEFYNISKRINSSSNIVINSYQKLARLGFSFSNEINEIIKHCHGNIDMHMIIIECQFKIRPFMHQSGIAPTIQKNNVDELNLSLDKLNDYITPIMNKISCVIDNKNSYDNFIKK